MCIRDRLDLVHRDLEVERPGSARGDEVAVHRRDLDDGGAEPRGGGTKRTRRELERLPPRALRAAAARFGAAVVQIATMYRHLVAARGPGSFDFEIAVDEVEPVSYTHLTLPNL